MCGIAGAFRKPAHGKVKKMLKRLAHRGPDGQGIDNLSHGTLGHTRLAILDVEGGHQPMVSGEAWIAFNGEIYNYRQLQRQYLDGQGLQTHSDTEVLLHLYRKLGTRCTELLDGMFAFAIVDGGELFMARDPLGIKPLYYGEKNGVFYFASEIKALAAVTDQIREFPPGHLYHSYSGWYKYYDLNRIQEFPYSESRAGEAIRTVLNEAVQKRLLADVPVGISLSGGLDSSIVARLISRGTEQLNSFAVGVEGSPDLEAARQMSGVLGTRHHEHVYTDQDMLAALPEAIYHLESFDPALVRSAIPNYFLARMACEHVKVMLTGEGADEIYAGYDYMRTYDDPALLQREMVKITSALHNTNLQRADRIAMAFGLEARVPFLDVKSVALSLGMPPVWKTHRKRPPKSLLRNAFRKDLPAEIVDRPKQKFSAGAGSADIIAQVAESRVTDFDFQSERTRLLREWDYRLPNKEALYYYRILRRNFDDRWIFPTMGQSRSL